MKAQVLREETGPGGLELVDVDEPVPGPGQYLIDIKACGVCFPDVLMSRGLYQMRPPLPFTPGTEVAGVVRAAPEGGNTGSGTRSWSSPGSVALPSEWSPCQSRCCLRPQS